MLASDAREILIRWGEVEIARTTRALRVLETANPPSFYLPWIDVAGDFLVAAAGSLSECASVPTGWLRRD